MSVTNCAEEDKKVLCQLLGKLFIPETLDDDKLRTLKLLMDNLRSVSQNVPHFNN
jgi:condensin complex subunit 3